MADPFKRPVPPIVATFNGVCLLCDRTFERGDLVKSFKAGEYAHADCEAAALKFRQENIAQQARWEQYKEDLRQNRLRVLIERTRIEAEKAVQAEMDSLALEEDLRRAAASRSTRANWLERLAKEELTIIDGSSLAPGPLSAVPVCRLCEKQIEDGQVLILSGNYLNHYSCSTKPRSTFELESIRKIVE